MLAHLKNITGLSLDPLQFAYRANRFEDDAVNMRLHYILQHLDRAGTYVRILFVDFSSAFNNIIPKRLMPKLTQLSVPTSVCKCITSFLTDRQQLVWLGKYTFSTRTISTGAAQGLCSLPTALLPLHQRLHIYRPLCQAPEVCGWHHTDLPFPGWWRVCLQKGGQGAGCLVQS